MAGAPPDSRATLIVPHAAGRPGAATIAPHVVEPAPTAPANPASPVPASPAPAPAPAGLGGSTDAASAGGPSTSAAPPPFAGTSSDLEADARHRFAGTPDFYQRDPVGAIFQVLPMSPPLADQLRAYIAEQRDLLASTDDLAAYLDVMSKIMDAELALGYVEGWDPKLSIDIEAEARHLFAGTPDFYQRDPVAAVFGALPTVGQVTSIADQLRSEIASSNNDPESYFASLRTLTAVEEVLGRLEEARAAQGRLETRAILGYSEVGDRDCPYMTYAFINDADLRNTGDC
ncbi:MAG TPA: hypothetical protein VHI77_09040 [Solirubrobacterales bacterium]|nr:hypothetical protein [Solirubrobacterales bacterium]